MLMYCDLWLKVSKNWIVDGFTARNFRIIMIYPAAFFSSGTCPVFFWTSEQTFEEAETVIHFLGDVISDNHFDILSD